MATKEKLITICLILVIVVGAVVLAVCVTELILHNQQKTAAVQKAGRPVTAQIPTPASLFTVTLSPSSQTVVQELNQAATFTVTITGNPNYPCAIVFHSNNLPDNLLFELGLSSIGYTTARSIYTVSGGFVYVGGNTGAYSIYVTVIDSNGNSYNSNSVSVIIK